MRQSELARRSGITQGQLQHIEIGRSGCGRKAAQGLEKGTGRAISLRALLAWPSNAEVAAQTKLDAV